MSVKRAVFQIVGVVSLAGLALRGVDAVPGAVLGLPRGVILCASVEEAEARWGTRVGLPTGLAEAFVWPPREIRYALRPVPALALRLEAREGAGSLTIYRSRGPAIPERLRPPGRAFHSLEVRVKGRAALLTTLTLGDGRVWQDLEWTEAGGRTGLRFQGPTVELVRLAEAVLEAEL